MHYLISASLINKLSPEGLKNYKIAIRLCVQRGNKIRFFYDSHDASQRQRFLQKKKEIDQFLAQSAVELPIHESFHSAHVKVISVAKAGSFTLVDENQSDALLWQNEKDFYEGQLIPAYSELIKTLKDTPVFSSARTKKLLSDYAFAMAAFTQMEYQTSVEDPYQTGEWVLLNLLAKKSQWDLLVIGLATVPPENCQQIVFNNSSVLREAVQMKNNIYHQFQKVSRKRLLNTYKISQDTLWDQICFLARGSENLEKAGFFSKDDCYEILLKLDKLVEQGCKKARGLSFEEELIFIGKVMRGHSCSAVMRPWLLERIKTACGALVETVNKEVISTKSASENGAQNHGTPLERAIYQENWRGVVEELVNIPLNSWSDLTYLIAEPSANLAVKAFLISAILTRANRSDGSKTTLAHLLAKALIGIAREREDGLAYLESALNNSVLFYVLDGGAPYHYFRDKSAFAWIENAMHDMQPNSLLDDFCEENLPEIPMEIINFLASCESTAPLPCKEKNKDKINNRCQGAALSEAIIKHYQLALEADSDRTSDQHHTLAMELKKLLNPEYRLVFMLGSASEIIRQAYNRQRRLKIIRKLEDTPLRQPCENPHYSDFFYSWLSQLDLLIRHKCNLFRQKLLGSTVWHLFDKTDQQMVEELKTLDVLREALIGAEARAQKQGLDHEFKTQLNASLSEIMQNHSYGFAKHGKGVLGPIPSKMWKFYENLKEAAVTVDKTAMRYFDISSL